MTSIDFDIQVSFPLWSRESEILERSELESGILPPTPASLIPRMRLLIFRLQTLFLYLSCRPPKDEAAYSVKGTVYNT